MMSKKIFKNWKKTENVLERKILLRTSESKKKKIFP